MTSTDHTSRTTRICAPTGRSPVSQLHAGGGQLEAGVEGRHRQQIVAGEEPVPPDEVEQRVC
jgi:hypothetical protein